MTRDENFHHAAKQASIALGLAIATAALCNIDATPMEEFDPIALDEALGLPDKGLRSSMLLALGFRDETRLGRFLKNAGTAAGLTGGGMYIVSSLISYGLVSLYGIRTQTILGAANITGVILIAILFITFSKFRNIRLRNEAISANVALAS